MGRKPMQLIKSDRYYAEFLLSIQNYQRDLRDGNSISVDEMRGHFEPFYAKLEKTQIKDYCEWLRSNRLKIAHDIEKVLKHGVEHIRAPENERKRIEFNKYVDAIMQVCDSPEDFQDILKKRASEVALEMYSETYYLNKLMTVKNYIRRNYIVLKAEVEKQMNKANRKKL